MTICRNMTITANGIANKNRKLSKTINSVWIEEVLILQSSVFRVVDFGPQINLI